MLARLIGYSTSAVGSGLALAAAITTLLSGSVWEADIFRPTPYLVVSLRLDPLAAAFILILGAAGLAVSVAALGYSRAYDHHGGARLASLHGLFLAAMLVVVLADDVFTFLLAWEAMSLVGYLLVVHEHAASGGRGPREDVQRAGFVFLVMAHLATAFIVGGFFTLSAAAGGSLDFAALRTATLEPIWRDLVFLACLLGFATKAGAAPLHVWLPRAHPVAPSHASALMSGVMLKVALYGLARVTFDLLGGGPAWWGWVILALGTLSAVLGALYALVERDLKRLLAYSSVENVGIILIGFGAALTLGASARAAATLALGAALFHAFNHGLFKSLLFVGAGVVDQAAGTRDLDRLGGLGRAMPRTSVLFLIGATAIAGLPPLNGFAGEWLTVQALLALGQIGGWESIGAIVAVALLALTAGLAAAAFAKAFGITFLGLPRAGHPVARDPAPAVQVGLALAAIPCVVLGLLPGVVPGLLASAAQVAARGAVTPMELPGSAVALVSTGGSEILPSLAPGLALACAGVGWLLFRALGRVPTRRGAVWVCGFPLGPRMQYSSTSFAEPARLFFRSLLRPRRVTVPLGGLAPYFPARLVTRGETPLLLERHLYSPTAHALLRIANTLRWIQSGSLRHYLLYVFATLVVLLVLAR